MTKNQMINSDEDYALTVKAHKNLFIISAGSLIISVLCGVIGIGAVTFSYTGSDIINWLILGLLFVITLFAFFMFIFALSQAGVYERQLAEYKINNRIDMKVKSINSFVKNSIFSIMAIFIIVFILHSLYVN